MKEKGMIVIGVPSCCSNIRFIALMFLLSCSLTRPSVSASTRPVRCTVGCPSLAVARRACSLCRWWPYSQSTRLIKGKVVLLRCRLTCPAVFRVRVCRLPSSPFSNTLRLSFTCRLFVYCSLRRITPPKSDHHHPLLNPRPYQHQRLPDSDFTVQLMGNSSKKSRQLLCVSSFKCLCEL